MKNAIKICREFPHRSLVSLINLDLKRNEYFVNSCYQIPNIRNKKSKVLSGTDFENTPTFFDPNIFHVAELLEKLTVKNAHEGTSAKNMNWTSMNSTALNETRTKCPTFSFFCAIFPRPIVKLFFDFCDDFDFFPSPCCGSRVLTIWKQHSRRVTCLIHDPTLSCCLSGSDAMLSGSLGRG